MLLSRPDNGAAAPEIIIHIQTADIGRSNVNAILDDRGFQGGRSEIRAMALGQSRTVDEKAASLGHIVPGQFREGIVIIADGAANRAPLRMEDERLVPPGGPVRFRRRQVHFMIGPFQSFRRENGQPVIDDIRILIIPDGHAENDIHAQLLRELCHLQRTWPRHRFRQLVLHLFFERLICFIVVAGEAHFREYNDLAALAVSTFDIFFNPSQVGRLIAPHRMKSNHRNRTDILHDKPLLVNKKVPTGKIPISTFASSVWLQYSPLPGESQSFFRRLWWFLPRGHENFFLPSLPIFFYPLHFSSEARRQ